VETLGDTDSNVSQPAVGMAELEPELVTTVSPILRACALVETLRDRSRALDSHLCVSRSLLHSTAV
jgi:hypothetical protein